MSNTRYFVELAYDGTNYHGWQRQPNGSSVQQTLEESFSLILRENILLTGAGRTDSGVHASQYFAHFDTDHPVALEMADKLVFKLNSLLPPDIAIKKIFPVAPGLHARFSAVSRTYKYYITRVKNPFRVPYTCYLYGSFDVDLMNKGSRMMMECEDFTSFSKVDTDTRTNICKVTRATWEWEGDELVFTITANRFLRNMVRAIVGTMIILGRNKMDLTDLERIISAKNRSDAGDSVAASGLHLEKIDYPPDSFTPGG